MAAATLLFGNLAALKQRNVKRLMGLSGISHAGFMLIAVVSGVGRPRSHRRGVFLPLRLPLASFAVFGVMTVLAGPDDTVQELAGYAGLAKESPFLAGVLACGLGSLAGSPRSPASWGSSMSSSRLSGRATIGLLAVAIASVVISIYYYFGWIRAAYFSDEAAISPETAECVRTGAGLTLRVTLAALVAGSVLLGFFQGPLGILMSGR